MVEHRDFSVFRNTAEKSVIVSAIPPPIEKIENIKLSSWSTVLLNPYTFVILTDCGKLFLRFGIIHADKVRFLHFFI